MLFVIHWCADLRLVILYLWLLFSIWIATTSLDCQKFIFVVIIMDKWVQILPISWSFTCHLIVTGWKWFWKQGSGGVCTIHLPFYSFFISSKFLFVIYAVNYREDWKLCVLLFRTSRKLCLPLWNIVGWCSLSPAMIYLIRHSISILASWEVVSEIGILAKNFLFHQKTLTQWQGGIVFTMFIYI